MKTKLLKLLKYITREVLIWLVLSLPFIILFCVWFGIETKSFVLGLVVGIISAQLNAIKQNIR